MGLFRRSGVEERGFSASDVIALMNDRRRSGSMPPSVTTESAMRLSAVWACVRLLAGLGSTLPLDQQRRRDGLTVDVPRSVLFDQPQAGTTLSPSAQSSAAKAPRRSTPWGPQSTLLGCRGWWMGQSVSVSSCP